MDFHSPPLQGAIGTCWLISVLHSLWIHRSDFLKTMVRDTGSHVEVRLKNHTVWVLKRFPRWASVPLWCSAIEAAFAVVMGGYARLHWGRVAKACELLGLNARELTGPMVAVIRTPQGLHAVAPVLCYSLGLEP